jgi:hypothetical protein
MGLMAAIAAAALWCSRRPHHLLSSTLEAAILVCCAIPAIDSINTKAYVIGDYRSGFRTVGFEQKYSHMDLPNKDHIHQRDTKVYETFYVLMQRMHVMPTSADSIRDLTACDAIVMINPAKDIESPDVARLRAELEHGGSVVLMLGKESHDRDPVAAAAERFNRLLGRLGVGERFVVFREVAVTDLYGPLMEPSVCTDAELLAGIEPADDRAGVLLRCAEGRSVVVTRKYGKGKLILCSVAELYSNPSIGQPSTVPDGRQATLLRSCFRFVGEAVVWEKDQTKYEAAWESYLAEWADAKPWDAGSPSH